MACSLKLAEVDAEERLQHVFVLLLAEVFDVMTGEREEEFTASLNAVYRKWSFILVGVPVATQAAKPNPWDCWKNAMLGYDPGTVVHVEFDRRGINEVLHQLGCEVRLRWRTEEWIERNRHFLDKGRFRLGQRTGELALSVTSAKPRNPGLCDATPSE